MKQTDYPEWQFAPAFEAFIRQRTHRLTVVEPQATEGWERTASVTGMVGEIFERSARYYADWLAGHERARWRHIERTIAAIGARGRDEGTETDA